MIRALWVPPKPDQVFPARHATAVSTTTLDRRLATPRCRRS